MSCPRAHTSTCGAVQCAHRYLWCCELCSQVPVVLSKYAHTYLWCCQVCTHVPLVLSSVHTRTSGAVQVCTHVPLVLSSVHTSTCGAVQVRTQVPVVYVVLSGVHTSTCGVHGAVRCAHKYLWCTWCCQVCTQVPVVLSSVHNKSTCGAVQVCTEVPFVLSSMHTGTCDAVKCEHKYL